MRKRFSLSSPTFWATSHSVFEQAFWIVLFALQAPMLGPHAFGVMALAMVFVGFCEFVFVNVASESLVSLNAVDDRHFDSMLTVTVIASIVAAGAIFTGASVYRQLFHDAELGKVLQWMAILPVVSALSSAPTAMAQRNMQFRVLAQRSIVSLIAGGGVGLVLTLTGAGVWALVWQAIVQRVVGTIALWLFVPLPFRLALSRPHLSDLWGFAAKMALSRTMNWSQGPLSRLILGLYLGPTDLGIFSLATRLNNILVQVSLAPQIGVARVDLRRFKIDPIGLEAAARRLFLITSLVCFPLFIGGAAVVPTLFHLWLGPEWSGSVVPSQLMILMGVPSVTFYCATALLLALNHQASEAFISTCQTVSISLLVLVTAPFGLVAATAAIALRQFALLPLPVLLVHRKCGLSMRTITVSQLPALLAAMAVGLLVLVMAPTLEAQLGSAAALVVLVGGGAALYTLLVALMLPGPTGQVAQHLMRILHG